jgi:dTDP-4-dehydrorhamnose reductase
MRLLLLGKLGQLGWELNRSLAPLGDILALDIPEIDLTKEEQIRQLLREVRPEVIVNATAYTAVDRAESEADLAFAMNTRAPDIIAEEAHTVKAALIHFSTDYVFDGSKGSPYLETDTPDPLGVYASSKLAGERAIQNTNATYMIIRTSWLYSLRRESFVTKVLEWSRQQTTLRVVSDQVGNPTWARMLAEITAQMLATGGRNIVDWLRERRGLYHLAGSGTASRFEWAQAILRHDPRKEEQVIKEILPALTADFPTTAQRPLYSALNCERFVQTFGLRLPEWEDALQLAMDTAG